MAYCQLLVFLAVGLPETRGTSEIHSMTTQKLHETGVGWEISVGNKKISSDGGRVEEVTLHVLEDAGILWQKAVDYSVSTCWFVSKTQHLQHVLILILWYYWIYQVEVTDWVFYSCELPHWDYKYEPPHLALLVRFLMWTLTHQKVACQHLQTWEYRVPGYAGAIGFRCCYLAIQLNCSESDFALDFMYRTDFPEYSESKRKFHTTRKMLLTVKSDFLRLDHTSIVLVLVLHEWVWDSTKCQLKHLQCSLLFWPPCSEFLFLLPFLFLCPFPLSLFFILPSSFSFQSTGGPHL